MRFDGWLRTPVGLSAATAKTRAKKLPSPTPQSNAYVVSGMLSIQNVDAVAGKVLLLESSRRYVSASETRRQWYRITSRGWNVEYPCVGSSEGVPGAPAPAPVATTLRVAD